MVLWNEEEVLRQFTQGGHLNTSIYEVLVAGVCAQGHSWLVWQYCIKVKALWAHWVTVTGHNHQSSGAPKMMAFMQELTHVLAPHDPVPHPDTSGGPWGP